MPYVEWGEVTAAVRNSNTVELTWQLTDGDGERTRYQVWYKKSSSSTWSTGVYLSANAPNYVYNNLAKDTKYDFCLRCYYRYNENQPWNYDQADTYVYGVSTASITSVSLSAEPSSGNISATWITNPKAQVGTSTIYWRDQAEVDTNKSTQYWPDEVLSPSGWHFMDNVTGNSTTINGLKGGRWYTVYVRQYFEGSATYTELVKKVWVDCLDGLKYSIDSAKQVSLTWTPNAALSELSYGGTADGHPTKGATVRIWKQEVSANNDWVELPSLAPSATTCVIPDLVPGRRYRFCVRIQDWNYPQKYYNVGKWDGDNYTPWIVMPTYQPPKPVTSLKASYNSLMQRVTLFWVNNDIAITRPYNEIHVYRQTDGGAYEDIAQVQGETYIDTVVGGHTYRYMVQAINDSGWSTATYTNTITAIPVKPNPPTNLTATRGVNGIDVAWESASEDGKQYKKIRIERSVNGGAWTSIVEVSGDVVAYTDTTVKDNNSYRYRIKAINQGGASDYTQTQAVKMPPSPPKKPTVVRTQGGICLVGWTTDARNVTGQEIRGEGQLSGLQSSVVLASGARSFTDTGALTDEPMRYQIRSIMMDGTEEEDLVVSEWSEPSAWCQPCAAPNAPSIREPIAGSTTPYEVVTYDEITYQVIDTKDIAITVRWRHNPKDGSEQTQAQLKLSCTGEAIQSGTITLDGFTNEYTLHASSVLNVDEINALDDETFNALRWTIAVRTKGAKDEYSPWTETPINIRRRPQVSFETPSSDDFADAEGNPLDYARVTTYPLTVKLQTDMHADALAEVWLLIESEDGQQVEITDGKETWQDGYTDQPMFVVSAKQWAPKNHEHYSITATVRSASGLTAQASIPIYADFPEPKQSSLRIKCDPDRGYITLEPHVDSNDHTNREVTTLDVWRVVDDQVVLIAQGLANGEQVVDKFAPLNKEFIYRLAAYSDQGVYRTVDHKGMIKTDYCFAYFGNDFGHIARGRMRPQESITTTRSKQTQVEYAGREFGVVYDGGGISETHSVTILVSGEEELDEFREMANHGRVFFKSLEGYAFMATCELTIATQNELPWKYKQVGLELTRIDSEVL